MQSNMSSNCCYFFFFFSTLLLGAPGYECGPETNHTLLCPEGLCCSIYGHCGDTEAYRGKDCESQSPTPAPTPAPAPAPAPAPSPVSALLSRKEFDDLLPHRNDSRCRAHGFYTYDAFIKAANFFSEFAAVGDDKTRIKDILAFLAQTSYATQEYCFKEKSQPSPNCNQSSEWPCAPGKSYNRRGPFQISWNYVYGPAGKAIGEDLLNYPELVSTDPVISFKTAIWFWTIQHKKAPSCDHVMSGIWMPSEADLAAKRFPGYGVTTNVINGADECGNGETQSGKKRVKIYTTFCEKLGVDTGDNLDCYDQTPFNPHLSAL